MNSVKSTLWLAACAAACISCGKNIEFDACGQIDATQVTVSAESSGKLLSLNLEEGDILHRGQMLGAIDSVQTYLQTRELQERIEGARARLIDIPSQLAPQKNQLASLEKDLARFKSLLAREAATAKQVDDIESQIDILKAQIAAQQQSWERSNSSVESEIATYRVQLAQREDQLAKCDLSKVYVRAYFTTEQLAGIRLGDKLSVIPDDGSARPKEYEGTVSWISDQAEFTPKNIQTRDERADLVYAVKLSVPNDGSLRLGMYAYVRK